MPMQAELNQFERNQVWELVPKPNGAMIIGTRWVFRNKENEDGRWSQTNPELWPKDIFKKKA